VRRLSRKKPGAERRQQSIPPVVGGAAADADQNFSAPSSSTRASSSPVPREVVLNGFRSAGPNQRQPGCAAISITARRPLFYKAVARLHRLAQRAGDPCRPVVAIQRHNHRLHSTLATVGNWHLAESGAREVGGCGLLE